MRKSARAAGGWGRGRWATSRLRWGLGLAITAAGVAVGSWAQAAITVSEPTIKGRSKKDTREKQYEFYISKTDCLNNITFTFDVSGVDESNFELWRSEGTNNCATSAGQTDPDNLDKCVNLERNLVSGKVEVTAQQILQKFGSVIDADKCTDTDTSDKGRDIVLYFLDTGTPGSGATGMGGGSGTTGGDYASYSWKQTWIDLVPPNAPTGVSLDAGSHLLFVNYNRPAGSNPNKYSIFCAPNTASAGDVSGAGEASSASSAGGIGGAGGASSTSSASGAGGAGGAGGARGAGGAGGAGGASGNEDPGDMNCSLPNVSYGQIPDTPGQCGDFLASAAQQKTTLKELNNGTTYAIAIASVDEVNNIGPLSQIRCATPLRTNDFFDSYKEAGGKAGNGCGLCSVGGDSRPSFLALVGPALALAAFAGRRARRRAKARRPEAE